LPYAAALARTYEAKIIAAHVAAAEDFMFNAPDLWPAPLQNEGELEHEAFKHLDAQMGELPHESLFGAGEIWEVLAGWIERKAIDLLVVGTHGRTGARKLLMGSVAEKIFRQATCPVFTVGPRVPSKPQDAIAFRKILFATDFGEESLAALPYAISIAEENEGELTLLHVIEQPYAGIPDGEEVKQGNVERLQSLVPEEAQAWCRVRSQVEFSPQFARPATRIVEVAAAQGADLIVLGVRSSAGSVSTVSHMTSTTAQHVIAYSTCPVLTVRG